MKTMLEYVKTVLQKVSFDSDLFIHEFSKALGWLSKEEQQKLKDWVINNYRDKLTAENLKIRKG